MKHRLWQGLWTALVVFCGLGLSASDNLHVTVNYRNQAHLDPSMLTRATRLASKLFERAGITLEWKLECAGETVCDTAYTSGLHLVFLLSSEPSHPCPTRCSSCAVRFFDGTGGKVFILYDRAKDEAAVVRNDISASDSESATALVLGYVTAHEIGHLLLPNGRHAISGLMLERLNHAEWRTASRGALRFLPGEALAMRKHISSQLAPRP